MTWSHTCTGSNLILIAGFWAESSNTISGVTYNGVSMTQATLSGLTSGNNRVYLFYLVNPTTGANNIVATYANSGNLKYGIAESYTGAKQTGQPDAVANNVTNSATSLSNSPTTVAANSWIAAIAYGGNAATFAGTGSFAATPVFWGTGGPTSGLGWNGMCFLDTNAAIATPASTAVGLSMSGANNEMAIATMSIAPAVAATTTMPPDLRLAFI